MNPNNPVSALLEAIKELNLSINSFNKKKRKQQGFRKKEISRSNFFGNK